MKKSTSYFRYNSYKRSGSEGGCLAGWVGGMVSGYESLPRANDSGVLVLLGIVTLFEGHNGCHLAFLFFVRSHSFRTIIFLQFPHHLLFATVQANTLKGISMMPAPTIDHIIYTLSEIAVYYNYHPPQPGSTRTAISEDNRHSLEVLNLLSLLIVTGGSGDVAAMSLHATAAKGIELCYSKNRPCTQDEKDYITELFTIATDPNSSDDTKFSPLFKLVLRKCKDKIIARLHKLCSRLRYLDEPDDFLFVTLNSQAGVGNNSTQCSALIRELVGIERFPLDSSLMDFLKRWFRQLLSSLQPGSCFDFQANRRLVHETIAISHLLAHDPQAGLIPDLTLVRPIRKLGDYYAAIWVIIKELAKCNVGGQCRVSIKEVS